MGNSYLLLWVIVRAMKTIAALLLAAAVIFSAAPASASFAPNGGSRLRFDLYGPHLAGNGMRVWAHESAAPLPQVKIWVGYGDPVTYPGPEVYLPRVGSGGWTALAVRGLFYHELGHVFDHNYMTNSLRDEFRQEAGVPSSCWRWWHNCKTVRWVTAANYYISIPPGEMFAEEYAACSLGLTQREYQDARYNSYGWVPPRGTDETKLCGLISSAAAR